MTKTATFYEVDSGPSGTYWEYETNGYETVAYVDAEYIPEMIMQMAAEGYKVEVLSQAWYVEQQEEEYAGGAIDVPPTDDPEAAAERAYEMWIYTR